MDWKDELVTPEQAAHLLSIPETALRRLIEQGEIPSVKGNRGSLLVKRSDVEEYMVNHYRSRK